MAAKKRKKTRAAGAGSSTCKPASIYHLNLMHVAPAIRRTANLMGAARMPGAPANGMILAPWGSFASTAGGIHTTHAERRAARQSSSARTANATTPQVYPLLRRSSSARSPPRPAWPSTSVARARARGREAGRAQDTADLRRDASRSRTRESENELELDVVASTASTASHLDAAIMIR